MVGLKELDQFDYGVQYQRGQPSVTQVSGLAGLSSPAALNIANSTQNSLDDMRRLGEMPVVPPPPPTDAATKPVLAISRSTGKIWANGKLFTTDDAQGAVESEQFVGGAPVPAPAAEASDWEPLSMDAYSQHLQKIKNPGLGTLASKNFGIGVDNAQMLAGYGLQFLGAEEAGQGIVQQQLQDINKNAPYQRNFTDIGSGENRGYLDWFVANLAQQGPNLIESVVTAAIGAGAGALAGGGANPATAAGGVLTSLVGKQAFKQGLLSASKKYMAGEALDYAEQKLLREAAGITAAAIKAQGERVGKDMLVDAAGNITRYSGDDAIRALSAGMGPAAQAAAAGGRSQAIMGGAALASGLQNYATGVADLYGESVEGGDPSRGLAALGGIPYAALETVPEYIAALRIFKGIGARTTALAGKSALGKAGEIGARVGIGAGAGAALEGGAEVGQELLGIGMNDALDVDSPEGISRLINAFAAGAAIGGFVGAGSNLNTGKPHDILSGGTKPADLGGGTITQPDAPFTPRAPNPNATSFNDLSTGGPVFGRDPDEVLPPTGGAATTAGAPFGPGTVDGTVNPPTGGVGPQTVVSPPVGQTQQNMFPQQPAMQALPSATTVYNPAPTPSPMLTGPEIPQRPAPSVAPDVINLPGPGAGSALQQAAEGTLTGGVPTGPLANRLQQQAAAARARAQQEQAAAAEQARIAGVQATSGSALARIGRGELPPPINQPGGRVSMGGEATGQMVEPMTGKAKLKRRKKGKPLIEGLPANATQEGVVGQDRQQQYPQDGQGGQAAKAGRGDSLKRGRKAAQKEEVAQAEQQPGPEVSATPVHDKFIVDFDDAQLNDANKVKLRAIVNRARKAGVLTDKDMRELDIAFKDRDTSADDIAPLAVSLIEANKPKAAPTEAKTNKLKRGKATEQGKEVVPTEVKTEVVPDKKEPAKLKERKRLPTLDLKPKEEPSPKAEGAAAAPAQKAEKVSVDILRDAGWTASEINDYQRSGQGAERAAQAARGYTWIAGEYRAVTKKDIEDAKAAAEEYRTERLPKLRERVKNKFAEARARYRDFGPDSKLANVPYSDSPAVTEAEAMRMIEDDFSVRTVPKLERVYALTDEAKSQPGTALALVDDKKTHFVDPEIEAAIAREQAELRETERLAMQGADDAAEADDLMVQLNTLEPDSVEWNDALSSLLGLRNEINTGREKGKALRKRIDDYLANEIDPDAIRLAERATMEPVSQAELDRSTIVTAMEQINNGEIRLNQKIVGVLVSAWKRIKALNLMYGTTPLADYIKGGPQFFNMKDGKVVPKTEGRYSTVMWDVADRPMEPGAIKLKIQKLISGFARKPKVYVFRNQADLKASDPKLYARLAAGRPGDFDTVKAAGYSMGDTVVVFSDRIANEQHLSFVLAHETLGHFGLRGLMSGSDFDRVMTGLYDTDRRLKAGVDAAMNARGLSKAEAVEEYLSDYAAQLHTSLVRRVWKGIKGVLNRVGIRFGDEATRYLLSQAKRYVKTGEATGSFVTSSVAHRLWGVETGQVGRFSVVEASTEQELMAAKIRHARPLYPQSRTDARRMYTDLSINWDKFKERFFSLTNFQALRNPGAYEFDKLLAETRRYEEYVFNKYKEKLEPIIYKSEDHKNRVSRMLIDGRIVSVFRLMEKPLSTKEDRAATLFRVGTEADGPEGNGRLVPITENIEKYLARGILSFKEMKEGVTYTREFLGNDEKPVKETKTFEGFSDLTQEQYDDYVASRRAIAEVELELLRAKYEALLANNDISRRSVQRFTKKNKLEGEAAKLIDKTLVKFTTIYKSGYTTDDRGNIIPGSDQIDAADDFLAAVNKALISADNKNDKAVRDFFAGQKEDADDFMASLEAFRADRKVPDGDLTYLFQNEMKRIILDDLNIQVEEERAKRTMAGGYVPIIRDKAYEMRLQTFDAAGNPVPLHEDHQKLLVYSQFDNSRAAEETAVTFNADLEGKTVEMLVRQDDGTYRAQPVTLRAVYGEALQEVSADPALDLDEFMHGLRLFKINLTPDKMKKVITTLTQTGEQLRKRLEFNVVPGYDKNSGIFAMARHIQLRAGAIAKTKTRPRMRELMDRTNTESLEKWTGNKSAVFSLYNRVQSETNPDLKQHYKHQLDQALYMFKQTYSDVKEWDGSKAGYDKLQASGALDRYDFNRSYNAAQRTLDFLDNNRSSLESNFGNSKWASILRAATSVFQLGGSLAQGVMNMVSPYTNWIPYMASYNQRNGFGGGFSAGQVVAAYHRALAQVGAPGMVGGKYNTSEFYEELSNKPDELKRLGLTKEEAQFMSQEIREGKLIPAQSNALLGTARGGISNRYILRSMDIFMAPFNLSEQAARRAAALAAFRLSMSRISADTKLTDREKFDIARDFAIQSLDLTLGEYSVLNRPPAWRDGIQSFLYMYKVYPTTVIQLFRRLDRKGQIAMLGVMLLLSGATGLPFAEDIEDLVDTIAQMLGLQIGSIRAEFATMLDSVFPGLAPVVLKGAMNTVLGSPADVASRFSLGDFVPGTGILLAGSKLEEELKDIAGPMPAFWLGAAVTARDLIRAPFSETKDFQDVLRASPITAGRMAGDAWAYMANGAIVDRRGYVVSPDMNIGTVITRLLGFYPTAAADEYDAIRVAKRVNNYQKDVVASYRLAWIKAYNAKDNSTMRSIERAVDEWNRGAKGTGLEIANFRKNSLRAAKDSQMSATQRTLKSTGTAGREDVTRFTELLMGL